MRQSRCDMRAAATVTAKASDHDGMLISGVPIRGCRSALPLGPTFTFQEIGLGAVANRRRREGHWHADSDLSNCTRRDFQVSRR
jgi:hypothetical protein